MKPFHVLAPGEDDHESNRISTLYSYKILDTPRESTFDDITLTIAAQLEVPYVKIAFIDAHRLWCKSTVGFSSFDGPVEGSLGQLALLDPNHVIHIKNMADDLRITHPSRLVNDANIHSAIGIPILSVDGFVLGVIAAFDVNPREFNQEEIELIQKSSKQIAEILENKREADFLLDTLVEQREEIRSKTISNRIARTLIGSVGTREDFQSVINKFIEATIQEFGWWAGQVWFEGNEEFNSSEWLFSSSTPSSLYELNKHPGTSISNFNDIGQEQTPFVTTIKENVGISDLTWHPRKNELEIVGARTFLELTVSGSLQTSLKILFILPHARSVTATLDHVLENLAVLLPQVMKRAKDSQLLMFRATHDLVTGLLNRRGLEETYPDSLIDPTGSYSRLVMFFDVDHFKQINDNYGHAIGDEVLVEISKRLLNSSRPVDTVARIGGDEFMIITPSFDNEDTLISTVKRFLAEINRPITTSQHIEIEVKVSIGISYLQAHQSLKNAIDRADSMMYKAKYQGGHQFVLESINQQTNTSDFLQSLHETNYISEIRIKQMLNTDDEIVGFYVLLNLPNYFAPVAIMNIAQGIHEYVTKSLILETELPTLIINTPINTRISKSNFEALLDALVTIYKFHNISYGVDVHSSSPHVLSFIQELTRQGLVSPALMNCGSSGQELQLIQELKPSHLLIGHDLVLDSNVHNELIIKMLSAMSNEINVPLVVFESINKGYKAHLLSTNNLITIKNK